MAMGVKLAATIFLAAAGMAGAHDKVDTRAGPGAAIACAMCVGWNVPQQPFQVYGNTWYVGTGELSALLVTGDRGHILLDGALPQSAPLIRKNIEALGFRIEDVKLILNSHAHFDHAGGIAELQRASGAIVATSAHGAQVLRDGVVGGDDPQYDPKDLLRVPRLAAVTAVADGEALEVGSLAVTAHLTPGHTPGSTTWSWKSCERGRCLDIVYADSLTPVSSDGFYYSGDRGGADLSASFKASIDKVAALGCDVAVSTHPGFTGTMAKHAARTAASNPFIDPQGCRTLAFDAHARLAARLATERKQKAARQGRVRHATIPKI